MNPDIDTDFRPIFWGIVYGVLIFVIIGIAAHVLWS